MRLAAPSLLLLLLVAGASIASATVYFDVDLASHLKHFTKQRFPGDRFNAGRVEARKYIKGQFKRYGLKVVEQKFNTTVVSDPLGIGDVTEEVGVNIIGIAKAVCDKPGALLVIGADYDTNGVSDPVFNNGAGVAAMLETARIFMKNIEAENFIQKFTTIFVAFDLNTKEHESGSGKPGGWHFVYSWLWEHLKHSDVNFGGAFILDSIMNVNLNANTQIVNNDFRELFPKTYDRIVENDHTGNFLAMITRLDDKSTILKDQFSGSYNMERKRSQFWLEDMGLAGRVQLNEVMRELTKPETIHFWTFTFNQTQVPLPAILLTDTQELRLQPPLPDQCVKGCPVADLLTEDRVQFMDSTVKALARTLFRRQLEPVSERDAGGLALPSLLVTASVFALVRLLQ